MTDATTTLELGPMIQFVAPIAATIASAVISWGVATGVATFKKVTGVTIDAAQVEQVRSYANDQAAKAIAASTTNLAHESITVSSPMVATAVKSAQVMIPDLLKTTGVTPQGLADMITAEIGRLQSSPPTAVAPTPAAVPPPVAKSA